MSAPIVRIEPIYGNGWVSYPDQQSRDTPPPFAMDLIEGETSSGVIVTPNHEFECAAATITPRHSEATDILNVEIRVGSALIARGYARQI